MKYATGNYLILGFNEIGTKLMTHKAESQTHLGAIAEGEKMVEGGQLHTFVVLRVQHNSATRDRRPWE